MKRIVALLLSAILVMALCAGAVAEGSEYDVENRTYDGVTITLHTRWDVADTSGPLYQEIVDSFTSQNISYKNLDDIKRIIRYFFEYAEKMPRLHERLLCSGSYEHIGNRINEQIMAYRAERYRGAFSKNIYEDNLVFAYFSPITTILYRQWVKDGKKMPIEDLIATATKLVCGGMQEYIG